MKRNKWRWIISIFFLIITPILGVLHQIKGGGPSGTPSVDAICPFGGLETIYSLITKGEYIKKIEPSAIILLIVTVLLTVLFGRIFCGFICPLGTMQTLMNKLAKMLRIKQIKVNTMADKVLRYAKYFVLVVVLFLTYKIGELIIRPYDPWAAFMHISAGAEVFSDFFIGFIVLIVILILSMFIERAWCRYLCPLGAALSIISPIGIFKVNRKSSSCINCKICSKNCPVGLEIHNIERPSQTECIACGECVSKCPVQNTMQFKRKNTVISLNKLAIIAILIVVITTGAAIISGNFKSASSNTEVLMQEGTLNPENIKGYMTLDDICKEFKISHDMLLDELKLPKDTDLNRSMKDLSKELPQKGIQFDTESVRETVKKIIK